MPTFRLGQDEFVIDDYARARPFASFLPGIAGLWGIPMWAFYVNRGQAIAGFGVQDKEHPIMEFQPANRAYRSVSLSGFRTFLKLSGPGQAQVYEPFRTPAPGRHRGATELHQRMRLRMHELVLEETNPSLGIGVEVRYFTVPHEPFAALARILTITNHSRRRLRLELIDGLPAIVPAGMLDRFLKTMSRTLEAWVIVERVKGGVPFYRLKVEPHDRPDVVPIRDGHFYAGFSHDGTASRLVEPIVDPAVVFGHHDDLLVPGPFLDPAFRLPPRQSAAEKTPCAMGLTRAVLNARETFTLYALYGHAESAQRLARDLPTLLNPEFFSRKALANRQLIDGLTQPVETHSALRPFDLYCRQTFLDNLLRGGMPILFNGDAASRRRSKVLYVFSRKHGDLERDYNFFAVPATFFSQGNANYRDVNQNRRCDVWFYPDIGDHNVVTFFNLLQADGYNPLVVKGARFICPDPPPLPPALRDIVTKPFAPGELLAQIEHRHLKLDGSKKEELLQRVMASARQTEEAEHGEGFWTDHWTYNLDLLESYLGVYPERLREILLERRVFSFYDNAHVVAPRAKKYHSTHGVVRQSHGVVKDPDKAALIQARTEEPHSLRVDHGRGEVYTTTLLVKMLCVVANKLASLDPAGIGIEMEADKPNWCDALNGLPWLLGSSVCETFELKRWIVFLQRAIEQLRLAPRWAVEIPEELAEFVDRLCECLGQPAADYWQSGGAAKERFRQRVRLGFSGGQKRLRLSALRTFLKEGRRQVERGIERAYDPTPKLYRSYFYYHQPASSAKPAQWTQRRLPPFLEGMVHALRLETDPKRARALYRAVKASELYDAKLKMYRICGSLDGQPEEIGRCRIFSPGWLENQSIWLHMEYKYLLELLRAGLYEEFFEDFRAAAVPFQPAERYGRSILENSSFLVSSAYAETALHGAGFVARLSGATAEFLQMWQWMTAGLSPFALDDHGRLILRLSPILPRDFFRKDGRFECRFLGRTHLAYLNPRRLATFGRLRARPTAVRLEPGAGEPVLLKSAAIPAPYAEMVRDGKIRRIEVTLGPRVP